MNTKSAPDKKPLVKGIYKKPDLRFNISLVFLIAMLSISAYLLLFSLTENGKAFRDKVDQTSKIASANPVAENVPFEKNTALDDPALDFKLAIPFQTGQWMYRIGFVKGLTDDSLTNQFVKIYAPAKATADKSASFDENFKELLAIRKFSTEEWEDLEKGCGKGNILYCEGAGTKIDEKDGSVWAYTKQENCPGEIKTSCANVEKIIGSFHLK